MQRRGPPRRKETESWKEIIRGHVMQKRDCFAHMYLNEKHSTPEASMLLWLNSNESTGEPVEAREGQIPFTKYGLGSLLTCRNSGSQF